VKLDRISGRPAARMGAGGGTVVVIVDSSSGTTMDGWMDGAAVCESPVPARWRCLCHFHLVT